MKKIIIYLHGFNSASLDQSGSLLTSKQKLVVLDRYTKEKQIKFFTPNIDYRSFENVIRYLTELFDDFRSKGFKVLFMGSSLGGFTSEYMAVKTQSKAIMINPAISPSELLTQFIGVSENFELSEPFDWSMAHCEQFISYEAELSKHLNSKINRTILLDMADELIDSSSTLEKYKKIADVITYPGGSHGFEHIEEALPVIEKVIDSL
jgi:predicted esterase YcpF (UPF0227 family)